MDDHSGKKATPDCQPLLDAATRNVYQINAFRLLGLPVSASPRESAKKLERRRMLAELGQADTPTYGRLERKPPATDEELRAADAVLHDPEIRLVHELFWLWPLSVVSNDQDPALEALRTGDVATAVSHWDLACKNATADPAMAAIASHNLAIRWQLAALEIESMSNGAVWSDNNRERIERYWHAATNYWKDAITSDAVWNTLSARVLNLDDDRLSLAFVESLRKTAPNAVTKISADLALQYADAGLTVPACAHIKLLLSSPITAGPNCTINQYLLGELKLRVRQAVEDTNKGLEADRRTADTHAQRLVTVFSRYSDLLDQLALNGHKGDVDELFDLVALTVFRSAQIYYEEVDNEDTALPIYSLVLQFARSQEVWNQVAARIEIVKSNQVYVKATPFWKSLDALAAREDSAALRLANFLESVLPELTRFSDEISKFPNLRASFYQRLAFVLRNISVDAWNQSEDGKTALEALGHADLYALDPEIKEKLKSDRVTIERLYAAKRQKIAKERTKTAAMAFAGLLFFAYLGFSGSDKTPPPASPNNQYTPPSTYSPPAHSGTSTSNASPSTYGNPASNQSADRIYRVPTYRTAELERDKAAADAAEARAAEYARRLDSAREEIEYKQGRARSLKTEVDQLAQEIEGDRGLAQTGEPIAVANFNEKVDRYNGLVVQMRGMNAQANALVDPYNELLAETKQQEAIANQLIQAYNAKLVQYGH